MAIYDKINEVIFIFFFIINILPLQSRFVKAKSVAIKINASAFSSILMFALRTRYDQ